MASNRARQRLVLHARHGGLDDRQVDAEQFADRTHQGLPRGMRGAYDVRMSEHPARVMSRSARAVLAPALLLPFACLAALRAVTYLMQGAVTVELLPTFSIQASTGGLGLAIIGGALDLLIWVVVLKLSIEALCDAHEFEGTDHSKIEVVTDFAAVQLGILIVACMLPAYFALLKGHPGVAVLLAAIALVYLPAAVHLTVFGSLEEALSPLAWYGTVRTR